MNEEESEHEEQRDVMDEWCASIVLRPDDPAPAIRHRGTKSAVRDAVWRTLSENSWPHDATVEYAAGVRGVVWRPKDAPEVENG
jgi:hypothetical protein